MSLTIRDLPKITQLVSPATRIQTPSLTAQLDSTSPLKLLPLTSLLLPSPSTLSPSLCTLPHWSRDKALWDLQGEASARWLTLGQRLSRETGALDVSVGITAGTWVAFGGVCGEERGKDGGPNPGNSSICGISKKGGTSRADRGQGECLTTGHTLATCLMPSPGVCTQCVQPEAWLAVMKAHYLSGSRASHSPMQPSIHKSGLPSTPCP